MSNRIIGQAETHHSALNLSLTLCSEHMIGFRLSGWTRLQLNNVSSLKKSTDFLTKYALRNSNFEMSLWQYFSFTHNDNENSEQQKYVPYATGLNTTPTYPPNAAYARASLLKHRAWSIRNMPDYRSNVRVLELFEEFMIDVSCPRTLRNEFKCLEQNHMNEKRFKQPINNNIDPSNIFNDIVNEDEDDVDGLVSAMRSFPRQMKLTYDHKGYVFDRGVHFDWGKRSNKRDANLQGKTWLLDQIKTYYIHMSTLKDKELTLPRKTDGSHYMIEDLNVDQQEIAFMVMGNIIEWIFFPMVNTNKDVYSFQPLRMTIIGKAGSGKTFLIHTIITLVRKLIGVDESVILCGPTGM